MPDTYINPGFIFLLLANAQRRGILSGKSLIETPIKAVGWTLLLMFSCGIAVYTLYLVIIATIEYGDKMSFEGVELDTTHEKCSPY